MSFRALSRDARVRPVDAEMEIAESPRLGTGHSRHQSESNQLLPSPQNLFEYSATRHFQFPESRQTDPRFPVWSFDPRSFQRIRKQWWRDFFLDVLMMASGLPFFALAGAIIHFNGMVVKEQVLNDLGQCIKGVATLFPLIFSIVVGRALVKLASWRLERGAAIGLLEQLMGSRTVGGAISTQFRLRSVSLVALGLVLLWLLSPLGSQAVLRILTTSTISTIPIGNVTYFNIRQPSFSGYSSFYDSWYSGFASLFSAALLQSPEIKRGSMDLWGNVKIPYLSSLSNIEEDSEGWVQVPQNSSTTAYSSLFGIPVSGLTEGNTTFSLESTYLELTCQNLTSDFVRDVSEFVNPGLISTNGPFKSAQNITYQTPWAIGYIGTDVTALLPAGAFGTSKCLDCLPENVTGMSFFPGLLLYQDFEGAQNVTSIFCTPSQTYVESNVTCAKTVTGRSCAVTAQRLSTLPHMPTQLTYLSFGQTFTGLSDVLSGLPDATPQLDHIDPLQNYIANPNDNTFIQSAKWPAFSANNTNKESRFLSLPLEDFAVRLGQALNAYLFGSMLNSTEFLTGSSPISSTTPALDDSNLLSSIQNQSTTFTVPATIASNAKVYSVSYPWLACFLVASLAIPLSALAAAIFGSQTITRDYLGFVSSIAKESQYAGLPKGGVNMDGMQRTRELRHFRIRLGDIGDAEEGHEIGTGVALNVGILALGEEGATRSLDREKLYI